MTKDNQSYGTRQQLTKEVHNQHQMVVVSEDGLVRPDSVKCNIELGFSSDTQTQ